MIREFTRKQIFHNVSSRDVQPLPSDVLEDLNYDIENEDTEEIYKYIKEEIATTGFETNQKLSIEDYNEILMNLEYTYSVVKGFQIVPDRAKILGSMRKLMEKVELVRDNQIR